MQRIFRSLALVLALMSLAVGVASAHGGETVGDYEIVFGWRSEPAYAGQFNGPEIFITVAHGHDDGHTDEEASDDHAEGEDHSDTEDAFPAEIEVNLQAEVTFGPATTTVFFEQAWQEPGHYIADLIPSMPGDYVFHITGTIGDTAVDLTFDSADGQFSTVEPLTDIVFPVPEASSATIADLEARIAALEAALAELTGE